MINNRSVFRVLWGLSFYSVVAIASPGDVFAKATNPDSHASISTKEFSKSRVTFEVLPGETKLEKKYTVRMESYWNPFMKHSSTGTQQVDTSATYTDLNHSLGEWILIKKKYAPYE